MDDEGEGSVLSDYELNVMLDRIAKEITRDELKRMKFYYSALGKRLLGEIKTPLEFFDQMKRQGNLNRNNLLHLQAILWNLDRKDLYQRFVDFARKSDQKPLHFFTAEEEPEEGRSNVKFHVSGTATTRPMIQRLQALVARLLVVPQETIVLNGVRPFHSIVISFSIPDFVVEYLRKLTPVEKGLLGDIGVDSVYLQDVMITRIKGEIREEPSKLQEREEIQKIMTEKKQSENKLTDANIEIIQLKEKLEKLRISSHESESDAARCDPYKGRAPIVRRQSSCRHVLNEISVHLSQEHRQKLSSTVEFSSEESKNITNSNFLRTLIAKELKADIRHRVVEMIHGLEDEELSKEVKTYLNMLPEMDVEF